MKRTGKSKAPPPTWGMDIGKYLKPSQSGGSSAPSGAGASTGNVRKRTAGRVALIDNCMLSQDPDEEVQEVVWAASPGTAHAAGTARRAEANPTAPEHAPPGEPAQPPGIISSALGTQVASDTGHAGRGPQAASAGLAAAQAQDDAMKRLLIAAVTGGAGGSAASGGSQAAGTTGTRLAEPASTADGLPQARAAVQSCAASAVTGCARDQESMPCPHQLINAGSAEPLGVQSADGTAASSPCPATNKPSCTGGGGAGGLHGVVGSHVSKQQEQASDPGEEVTDDAILAQVLEWSHREAAKTPATAIRNRLRGPASAPRSQSTVLRTSTGSRGAAPRSHHPLRLCSTVKQPGQGNKRRALLDLLNQVEVAVQQFDSPAGTGLQQRSNTQPAPGTTAKRRAMGNSVTPTSFSLGRPAVDPATISPTVTTKGVPTETATDSFTTSRLGTISSKAAVIDAMPANQQNTDGASAAVAADASNASDRYHCSLQDYEDFLDSLDEDMLQVGGTASTAATNTTTVTLCQASAAATNQQVANLGVNATATPELNAGWQTAQTGMRSGRKWFEEQRQPLHPIQAPVRPATHLQAQPHSVQPLAHLECGPTAPSSVTGVTCQAPCLSQEPAKAIPKACHAHDHSIGDLQLPQVFPQANHILLLPPPQQGQSTLLPQPQNVGQPHGQAQCHATAPAAAGSSAAAQAPVQLVGDRRNVHYRVLQVEEEADEKRLRLVSEYPEQQGRSVWVHLHDMWADLPVQPGDTANLLAHVSTGQDGQLHATCNSTEGMIVLHPDLLLSGTTVTSAMDCPRKAWLSEVVGGGSSVAALLGTLLHEVVQVALTASMEGPVTAQHLENTVHATVNDAAMKLHEVGLDDGEARRDLLAKAPGVRAWVSHYVGRVPQQGMELRMGPGHKGPALQTSITQIADIEEQIWAPRYGLKGQLDASLWVGIAHAPEQVRGHHQRSGGPQSAPGGANAHQVQRFQGRASAPAAALVQGTSGCWTEPSSQQQTQHPWAVGSGGGMALNGSDAHVQGAVVPFEFKSGKHHHSHRAQVSLYLLLMEDRYQQPCDLGLLWNLNDGPAAMQAVRRVPGELACLMMHRNRLAAYLAAPVRAPPPMLQSDFQCGRCHAKVACSLYHKAVEGGNATSSGLGADAWNALTAHLSEAHCRFFAHWSMLLELEESGSRGKRAALWAAPGHERQAAGVCMAGLELVEYGGVVPTDSGNNHRYTFAKKTDALPSQQRQQCQQQHNQHQGQHFTEHQRHNQHLSQQHHQSSSLQHHQQGRCGVSLQDVAADAGNASIAVAAPPAEPNSAGVSDASTSFEVGDMLVLSLEGQHANVARVVVSAISKAEVHVLARKRIRLAHQILQDTAGQPAAALHIEQQHRQFPQQHQPQHQQHPQGTLCSSMPASGPLLPPGSWRLDRDEPASGGAIMRSNLVELMSGSSAVCSRLRQLVVDLAAPRSQRFTRPEQARPSASQSSQLRLTQAVSCGRLNPDQGEAVRAMLEMQDYALVLGMPGTGKTSTIVEAIQALLAAGRSVLLSAYTNSAVDNIALKLAAAGVDFVRLPGSSLTAVHPGVRAYVPGGAKHPDGTTSVGFGELVSRVRVVAATCLGMRHPLLARRVFDVCVLDEASQVSLPASLGPLARARAWVLVGDHYQLPPLVVNPQAAAQGYGESLFRRLCEAHPQAVVTLRRQYRMAAPIMSLSNALVYSGALQCGSQQVAEQHLRLPCWASLRAARPTLPDWVMQALDPSRHVVFLDTDTAADCQDVTAQDTVSNPGEAAVLQQLVAALLAAGLPAQQMGVVSTYRAQVSLIQRLLQTTGPRLTAAHSAACIDDTQQEPVAAEAGSGCVGGQVEVLTIDKYQGRDKEAILWSFVRSNENAQPGRLLADWQRVNVALTRAKAKLIMVGGARTLQAVPLLAALLDMLRAQNCVIVLPPNASSTAATHMAVQA